MSPEARGFLTVVFYGLFVGIAAVQAWLHWHESRSPKQRDDETDD